MVGKVISESKQSTVVAGYQKSIPVVQLVKDLLEQVAFVLSLE